MLSMLFAVASAQFGIVRCIIMFGKDVGSFIGSLGNGNSITAVCFLYPKVERGGFCKFCKSFKLKSI